MSKARIFVVARSQEKGNAKLVFNPGSHPMSLSQRGQGSDSGY